MNLSNFRHNLPIMKKILSLCLLCTLFFITSCDKDGTTVATKTELITSSSWKFDKATASGFDISGQIDACLKDNIITFQANGNGTIAEGAISCSPPAPPTFTWTFNSAETELNVSTPLFPGGTGTFVIVTLNQTNLVLSQTMNIPPVGNTTVVITFKH